MKKSIAIKLPILAMSLAVSSAHAFTDITGPLSLDFSGTVSNSTPRWLAQIPAEIATKASSFNTDILNANKDQGNLVWSDVWNLPVLEMVMSAPAQRQTGLDAVVQIGNSDNTANPSKQFTLQVQGDNGEAGELVMTVEEGSALLGRAFASAQEQYIGYYANTNYGTGLNAVELASTSSAFTELKNKTGLDYLGTDMSISRTDPDITGASDGASKGEFVASRSYLLTNIQLIFPENNVPNTWTASMPMTVSYR